MTVRSGRIAAFRQRGGLLRLGCPIATILAVEATVVAAPATARDKPRKCEFYVSSTGSDSNSGSQNSPLRTIGAASQLVQSGTTVHVAPGTYAGGFMTTTSGTSSAPITYISDVPYGAKIVGAGNASVSNAAGWENRGDYVNVTGFEIDGSGSQATAWAFGFYNGGSHVTFQGNEVHDVMTDPAAYVKLTAHDNGGAGVMMDNYYGGSDGKVLANVVRNIGPTGWRSYLVHGIYQTETGSVRYNTIHDVVGSGIHLWHAAHHISITNNTVDGAAGGAGIIVGSGDSGSSSTTGDYVVVAANIVVNSAASIQEVRLTITVRVAFTISP